MPKEENTKRDLVKRPKESKQNLPKGNNYLLAIAINEYANLPKLSNAVKDAEDIVQILIERYDFVEENVIRLYDEAAKLPQIYGALKQLTGSIRTNDNLLIYYAGHGFLDTTTNTGHLVPQAGKVGAHWDYLSNANLLSNIRAINSLHTF